MKVAGKVIVVTGAGGGIGGEIVAALLARGAKVLAADLRDENLHALKDKLGAGDELSIYALNITDRDAVAALAEYAVKTLGHVDGLINCAGIIQPFVKVADIDYDTIERVMNVNFCGTLYMTKAFLPHLLTRPDAHLVNVSSMGGFLPVPGQSIYGASKAAVKLLTEGLYAELLHTDVHVSVVFPGATRTDITKNSGVAAPGDASADTSHIPMLAADKAAKIIVDGMEADKPQIFTGEDSIMMNRFYRLSPVRATKLIARQMRSLLK